MENKKEPIVLVLDKMWKSYLISLLGGAPNSYIQQQIPKTITFHNFKSKKIKSKLCGTYCLYFFYLLEKMD